jgi:hypothetical protein
LFDGELVVYKDLENVPGCNQGGDGYVHVFEDEEGNQFKQTCKTDTTGSKITWAYTSKDGECVRNFAAVCMYPQAENSSTITGTSQFFTGSIWYSMDENSNNFYAHVFYRDTCCEIHKEFCSKDGKPNTHGENEPDIPVKEMSDSELEEYGCVRSPPWPFGP